MTTPNPTELDRVDPVHADFATRVGETITMMLADGASAPVTITACSDELSRLGQTSFTVSFRGGTGAPEAQGSFVLRGNGFGPAVVFLVPEQPEAGRADDAVSYLAVFNRLEKQGSLEEQVEVRE